MLKLQYTEINHFRSYIKTMYERAPVGKCLTTVPSLYWPKGEQATGDQMKAKNALTTACYLYI